MMNDDIAPMVSKELDKINEYLDKFENECGLPTTINNNTVNKATELLNIDFTTFKPTYEECQEYAAILSQYLLNISRVIAKDKCIVHWAKEKIKKILVNDMKKQTAYNYEERLAGAIQANTLASDINYAKMKAELRLLRLEPVYFNVKEIAHRLSELGKSMKGIKYD